MILSKYPHSMGKSCRTVALLNLLENNKVSMSEDIIFGLAEGLTFSFVRPQSSTEHKYFKALAPNLNQFGNFAKNLAIEYQVVTGADNQLDYIEGLLKYEKNAVICEVAPESYKKYLRNEKQRWEKVKMDMPMTSHITEVVGTDDKYVYIYENYSRELFHIPRKTFIKARNKKSDTYLNPHHRIHRFILPENLQQLDMKHIVRNAICNNISWYTSDYSSRLGYTAYNAFISDFPRLYEEFGEKNCKRSAMITGYLIKFVSPGMFRRSYGRYLAYCGKLLGQEKEFDELSRMLFKADYLWNRFAGLMLKKNIPIKERMQGEDVTKLLKMIDSVETPFIHKIAEVIFPWKLCQ